jgi:hypothetical protein
VASLLRKLTGYYVDRWSRVDGWDEIGWATPSKSVGVSVDDYHHSTDSSDRRR